MDITREDAISLLISQITKCNNDELSEILHPLGDKEDSGVLGYNFNVVYEYDDEDDSPKYQRRSY